MKRGFTLVEIIVSMMIFSIVAVVALAALVKIVDANKKAQTTHDAVTNLSFAMDTMSREMRSGSTYYCHVQDPVTEPLINFTTPLTQPGTGTCATAFGPSSGARAILFAFTSPKVITTGSGSPCQLIYAYRLRRPDPYTDWLLEKSEQTNCIATGRVSSRLNTTYNISSAQDTFLPIVSTTSVSINNYYVRMVANTFPLFFMELSGNAGVKESSKSYFTVQTASSPRVP